MHRSITALTVVLALVIAACSTESASTSTSTTTSTTLGTTTTTTLGSTTTSSVPAPAVDWDEIAAARYLVHGIDGIWTDSGVLIWETEPIYGPDTLARDRRGGFVWLDTAGLWWLAAGADQPTLAVAGIDGELVDVVDTASGPVARLGFVEPRYFDLTTGDEVDQPDGGLVGFDPIGRVPWTASNGLEAVIIGPEVELDDEGQPIRIIEHARLIVSRDGETIADLPAGSVYEPYARIHDFDGQRVLIARGPYEPALPEETFTLIDFTCGACATSFRASATWAAFTAGDSDWDGSGLDTQPRSLVAQQLVNDDIAELTDGVYLGFFPADSVGQDAIMFDLAVWFSGAEANRAAQDDGSEEVPVPNDFYIRNVSDRLWTVPVADSVSVASVWYDADTAPDTSGVPVPWDEFVRIMNSDVDDQLANMRFDPWWVTVENGQVVRLDEQYVP